MSTLVVSCGGTGDEWIESKGQSWCRVPDHLAWGLEDYLIVTTESGERLILCHMELVHAKGSITLRERPARRDDVRMWKYGPDA